MSAYTCERCGTDAPLSEPCKVCESAVRGVGGIHPESGALIFAILRRLAATRNALLDSRAIAAADLITARYELEVAQNQVAYLKDSESRLRQELYATTRRRQGEGRRRMRQRDELRLLRDRLAEYEKPVDDQALAETIYAVECEHAAFDAEARGEAVRGRAGWCGNCETFIAAIRKMHAAHDRTIGAYQELELEAVRLRQVEVLR